MALAGWRALAGRRPPSAEETKQRSNTAVASLQAAKEAGEKQHAEEDADDAAAAADPYGAILGYHDPNRDARSFLRRCVR